MTDERVEDRIEDPVERGVAVGERVQHVHRVHVEIVSGRLLTGDAHVQVVHGTRPVGRPADEVEAGH